MSLCKSPQLTLQKHLLTVLIQIVCEARLLQGDERSHLCLDILIFHSLSKKARTRQIGFSQM